MADPIVLAGDILSVEVRGLFLSQRVITRLWYECTVSPGGGNRQGYDTFITNWAAQVWPAFRLCISDKVTQTRLRIQKVFPIRAIYKDVTPNPVDGAVPGDPNATQVSGTIHWYGDAAGPANRNRVFLPGMSDAAIVDGFFDEAQTTAMEELGLRHRDFAVTQNGFTFVSRIVSKKGGMHTVPINNFTVSAIPTTQRKRRIGVGQ